MGLRRSQPKAGGTIVFIERKSIAVGCRNILPMWVTQNKISLHLATCFASDNKKRFSLPLAQGELPTEFDKI